MYVSISRICYNAQAKAKKENHNVEPMLLYVENHNVEPLYVEGLFKKNEGMNLDLLEKTSQRIIPRPRC